MSKVSVIFECSVTRKANLLYFHFPDVLVILNFKKYYTSVIIYAE